MGSRAKRARNGIQQPERAETMTAMPEAETNGIRPIPDLTRADMVFGHIKHLPPYDSIPEEFRRSSNPYAKFVSDWFFRGRTPDDMKRLKERPGVDRGKAPVAIKAALGSFEPKHEHKEAGVAYLASRWFTDESTWATKR